MCGSRALSPCRSWLNSRPKIRSSLPPLCARTAPSRKSSRCSASATRPSRRGSTVSPRLSSLLTPIRFRRAARCSSGWNAARFPQPMPSPSWRRASDSAVCDSGSARAPARDAVAAAIPALASASADRSRASAVGALRTALRAYRRLARVAGVMERACRLARNARRNLDAAKTDLHSRPLRRLAMSEHRRQILEMLSVGKITADEAERLIAALEKDAPSGGAPVAANCPAPKYLRVMVEQEKDRDGDTLAKTVNIRVPLQLLRAGVRLASL